MPYGFGRGMGFGFRGYSPPWPYVGRGRGGLPRGGYLFGMGGAPFTMAPQQPAYPYYPNTPPAYGYPPFGTQMTRSEEVNFLKDQAEAIKEQLKEIDTRIRELESEE